MGADYGNGCTEFEKIKDPLVPPGFAPLTSFILKRGGDVKKSEKSTTFPIASKPICTETIHEMDDRTAYEQVLMRRPWIIFDQSNHHKPEESHTEHRPMDLPSNAGRPKGTIHGCPNCSNCLKS